jgi:DNA-binding transcriptional LysR family regulator
MFGQIYILPLVTEFLDAYPEVDARLLFLDRVTNLVDEGIDIAIRIGHLPDSSHSAVRVGSVRRVVCGSPEYFERAGVPETPAELARHRVIAATSASSLTDWKFGPQGHETVAISPALFCNSNPAVIEAARSGWGVTRVLSYQVAQDLAEGRLASVLEDYEEEPFPVHIVHPEGRRASAKVRLFVDFAAKRLRANRFLN